MNPDLDISCITFGSPRVGDTAFSIYFNYKIKNSYRIVNNYDPIPCLPTSWRYKHVKGCLWIHNNSIKKEITSYRFWIFIKDYILHLFNYGNNYIEDHYCNNYIKNIKSF